MKKPYFSIITISYNSSTTIERTIKSVLAQTYKFYEYIIIDGASKDGTLDIVKKWEQKFEQRLKWKSEPDNGIYDAMNKGLRVASGDIIGIVNSDDWLQPESLEIVAKVFEANGCNSNALYCGGIYYYCIDGKVKRWDVNLNSFKRQVPLYIMSGIRHPATFVPKQVYEKVGMFDDLMKVSADQDFILRCHFEGVKFIEINTPLSNMSEGGISTKDEKWTRHFSTEDRKHMLRKFDKKGVSYIWLFYSWKFRGIIKRILKK